MSSWQTDLVVSLYKIAIMAEGERKQAALDEAIQIVDRLDAEGKLSPAQQGLEGQAAGLTAIGCPAFVTTLTEAPGALWQFGS